MLIASCKSGRLRPHAQTASSSQRMSPPNMSWFNVAINQYWFTHTESMTLYERDRFKVIGYSSPKPGAHVLLDSITLTYPPIKSSAQRTPRGTALGRGIQLLHTGCLRGASPMPLHLWLSPNRHAYSLHPKRRLRSAV